MELKSKFKNELNIEEEKNNNAFLLENAEINKVIDDLQLTLKSLNYTKKEINNILPRIINEKNKRDVFTKKGGEISFENLLKLAMNYLDNDSSNIVR